MRTRFAPSPTGYLHIGGVRTALFNWLLARQHGGQFVLRIDDTDQRRNVEEALAPILSGFRWLGLDWDEGPEVGGPHAPYYQSQRQARYAAAVEKLLASGHAYRDFALPEELDAERTEARERGASFVYSRRWMADTDAQAAAFAAEGRQGVVRLKMPREGACAFRDLVRGDVAFQWAHEQDHVIQRADGSCLYHIASVVDDAEFEITHVVRSEEHLSNTPRQIFIAQSLGYDLPEYAHLPYVAEPGSKSKLSKRKIAKYLKNREFKELYDYGAEIAAQVGLQHDAETFNPVLVDFYRETGFLPHAVINYLVLLGWAWDDRTEQFSVEEMVARFSLDSVNKAPASFDPAKLLAFQEREFQAVPIKRKVALVLPYLQRAGWVAEPPPCDIGPRIGQVVEAAGERLKIAGDILRCREFFVSDDELSYDSQALQKRVGAEGAAELLEKYRDGLTRVQPFEAAALEADLREFIEREGIKIGQIIHAVRVATTGSAVGLGMFQTLEILGRASCLRRIERALELVRQQ